MDLLWFAEGSISWDHLFEFSTCQEEWNNFYDIQHLSEIIIGQTKNVSYKIEL